jgi:hypothetical protein
VRFNCSTHLNTVLRSSKEVAALNDSVSQHNVHYPSFCLLYHYYSQHFEENNLCMNNRLQHYIVVTTELRSSHVLA